MCYSDIQYLYLARGLAEGVFPYTPTDDVPPSAQPNAATEEHQLSVEYPVLTGVWMGVTGMVTHAIGRNPDLDGVPHADVQVNLDAQFDSAIFWGGQRDRLLHHVAARAWPCWCSRNAEDHGTRCTSRRHRPWR